MQPHDFKQAIIMFVFWGIMVVNIAFANFGWCVVYMCGLYVRVPCVCVVGI